jgi:hypothetical protein
MSNRPPTLAFDLERDLRALSAMASHLTPYLYEDDVYGHLGPDLPQLTLGGLLLRLHRLARLSPTLDAAQQNQVREARSAFEAARSQWKTHYERKLGRELRSRIDALNRFLDECAADLRGCAASYPTQAEKRAMIEHLRAEADALDVLTDDQEARLNRVDQKLKRLLSEGDFISDARLKDAYPRDVFWWLYGFIPDESPKK